MYVQKQVDRLWSTTFAISFVIVFLTKYKLHYMLHVLRVLYLLALLKFVWAG
jgi:uncharacterized membrane protein YqjE